MQAAHFLGIHTRRQWTMFAIAAALVVLLLPALNSLGPASPLHAPDYVVNTAGKFLCYAIVAVALDLIWGYTGILSLGHGVFFALGGYAMGMYMMLDIAGEGVYRSKLPDFMVFLDWKELPWFWRASSIQASGKAVATRPYSSAVGVASTQSPS